MKTINIKIYLFAIALLSTLHLSAQPGSKGGGGRTDFDEAQVRAVCDAMQLTDKARTEFEKTYRKYLQEQRSLMQKRKNDLRTSKPEEMTDEEAEKLMLERIKTEEDLASLRSKYYHLLRKNATPRQMMRMYREEARIRTQVVRAAGERHAKRPSARK